MTASPDLVTLQGASRPQTTGASSANTSVHRRSMTRITRLAKAFGSAALAQHQSRDLSTPRWLQGFGRDVRVAARALRKRPSATILATLTLAVGVGATITVFTVLNALAFRNLPVKDPQQLVELSVSMGSLNTAGVSVPMFQALARSQRVFSHLIGFASTRANVEVGHDLQQLLALSVTGDF